MGSTTRLCEIYRNQHTGARDGVWIGWCVGTYVPGIPPCLRHRFSSDGRRVYVSPWASGASPACQMIAANVFTLFRFCLSKLLLESDSGDLASTRLVHARWLCRGGEPPLPTAELVRVLQPLQPLQRAMQRLHRCPATVEWTRGWMFLPSA